MIQTITNNISLNALVMTIALSSQPNGFGNFAVQGAVTGMFHFAATTSEIGTQKLG